MHRFVGTGLLAVADPVTVVGGWGGRSSPFSNCVEGPTTAPVSRIFRTYAMVENGKAGMGPGSRWGEVLGILGDLIKFKSKADALSWREALENMEVYLQVRRAPMRPHHQIQGHPHPPPSSIPGPGLPRLYLNTHA